ncbi:hypothetical protein Rsub_05709 [Raphidocelis subcapitata]|uniref:Uncharacterized protein n=1 Tax=Raphidocelis subcapitata TaxID=307507 RepID=A0A2V0NZN2_9CHLO|nr:hypothetical protein Rsub_05709 [Raphidocelis subcapitata]|eukprot:GBF93098.1 hypothetical protein Rsub_05709 [Raphidocelis subcapitata]
MKSAALAALLLIAAAAPALACDYTLRDPSTGAPYVNETKVTDARLPASRPPLWSFRTLQSATWACTKKGSGWTLTITHAPIPGVTKEAFKWMWANLATKAAGPDGKQYSLFELFHLRDHAFHDSTTKPMAKGAIATFVEFPLTGCSGSGPGKPWTCPPAGSANPGFVQSSPQSEWQCLDQVYSTATKVLTFSTSTVKFGTQGCSPTNPKACTWIITTQHKWKFIKPKNELSVQTTLRVGYGNPTNDVKIVDGWRNGIDAQEKCERQALHFVEEIGSTEHWLQAAYKAANP